MTVDEKRQKEVAVFERSATPDRCEVNVAEHNLTFERKGGSIREVSDYAVHGDAGPLSSIYKQAARAVAERYMISLAEKQQGGESATH